RFEEAEKLLLDGVTVTSAAEILGFDTVHSFSRAFKTRYGTSPQNFIRQNKA
ncbi:MAG: AraC family transcriptional regulator, partial [Bacteroidales bacterium]|nr:AraC family transcriptional regulator [Bacteroidales bacterium]